MGVSGSSPSSTDFNEATVGGGRTNVLSSLYASLTCAVSQAVGPWMPASLGYSALRGDLYFSSAGVAMPVTLLAAWAAAGVLLVLLIAGVSRIRRRAVA